jgi:hypothetical protein
MPRRGGEVRPRKGDSSKGGLRDGEDRARRNLSSKRKIMRATLCERENQRKKSALNERGCDEASGG